MKAVIQRIANASVKVNHEIVGEINTGLLILLGIAPDDGLEDIEYLVRKITQMRIFSDENGLMNLSNTDVDGEYLVISQFTLFASTKKGNRPSYTKSAPPQIAEQLYIDFTEHLNKATGKKCATGIFGADMKVSLLNDGPVTIVMDSKNRE